MVDPEPVRTQQIANQLMERGELGRAKAVLEHICAVNCEPPPELSTQLLSTCAQLGDVAGAEAAAQLLLQSGPLSDMQVSLLRQSLGGDRAEELLRDGARNPRREAASGRVVNGKSPSKRIPARSQTLAKNQKPSGPTSPPKSGAPKAVPKQKFAMGGTSSRGRTALSSR